MKRFIFTAIAPAMLLSACASAPESVAPSFVPVSAYADMSCRALNAEARRVSSDLLTVTGQQQKAAANDAALTAVSLVVFWPAAFFISGGDNAAQLARLKGEAEAISAAARQKGC